MALFVTISNLWFVVCTVWCLLLLNLVVCVCVMPPSPSVVENAKAIAIAVYRVSACSAMRDSWARSRTIKEFRRANLLLFLAGSADEEGNEPVDLDRSGKEAKETLDTDLVSSLVFRSSSDALATLSRRTSQLSRAVSLSSRSSERLVLLS